jgi:hypothetical protein
MRACCGLLGLKLEQTRPGSPDASKTSADSHATRSRRLFLDYYEIGTYRPARC